MLEDYGYTNRYSPTIYICLFHCLNNKLQSIITLNSFINTSDTLQGKINYKIYLITANYK